jgi:putative ABC transport system permease protein
VQPALGRAFLPEEHRGNAMLANVILSHGLWQRAFGGDAGILGRRITLLGLPSTVIGVMPAGFSFPAGSELWISARALPDGNARTAHNYFAIARLHPGVAVEAARADIRAVVRGLKQQFPGPYQTEDAVVEPLARHLAGSARPALLLLFAAVGLLLLIVCVNVANLLLVQAATRAWELAVRTAMGAARGDLFRSLLAESLLMAAAGGAAGLLLAYWSADLLRVLLPAALPRASEFGIDAGVVAFCAGVSLAAGLLFGALPSWRASRPDVNELLRSGGRGQTASRWTQRTQSLLVVSEVALSLVLVAGAGLLVESFARLRAVDAGFSPGGVLAASLSFPMRGGEVARLSMQYRDLLDRVRAIPRVEHAGIIKDLPLDPIQRGGNFLIDGRARDTAFETGYLVATPGMMEALGIPLVRGRAIAEGDVQSAPGVVVINEAMAHRFWPDRSPIGERIWVNSFEPKERWMTIVGVAGDVRQRGLTEPVPPLAYIPYAQVQLQAQLGSGNLVVRTTGDPGALAPAIRAALRAVNPEAAASFRTLDEVMAAATSRQRFQLQVLAAFAALALLLAAVGIYGVLSYAVTSSRAAIGIRLALGAAPGRIFRMITARAAVLTAAGAVLGSIGWMAMQSAMRSIVFGVSPTDARILSAAVAVMFATAMAACWFPARRAMRVDPVVALREE